MKSIIAACLSLAGCGQGPLGGSCAPPLDGWATPETGKPVHIIANTIRLDGEQIFWNGVRIDEQKLVVYVRQSAQTSPLPFLMLDIEKAPDCAFAARIRDLVDDAYPCGEGACGQGPKAAFERAPFKNSDAVTG